MNEIPTIKAKNFKLRTINLIKDKEDLISGISDPEVMKWLTLTYPYDEKKDWEGFLEYLSNDKLYYFAIDVGGKQVGAISLEIGSRPLSSHTADIGYLLNKEHWGKGIMTEALKLVTKFAFEELKIHKINVSLFAENIGSGKVLEKSGYELEATLKDNLFKHRSYHDELVFCKINKK